MSTKGDLILFCFYDEKVYNNIQEKLYYGMDETGV